MPPHLPAGGGNAINRHRKTADGFVTNSQTNLPANIKCFVCKKSKPRGEFANRQIQKFADTIHNPYAPRGRTTANPKTTCKSCTPQQTTNLTCVICSKTKPLDQFAKNQRKRPHEARCERCVRMHLDTEPDYEPPDSDEYADSDSDDGDFDGVENQKPAPRLAGGAGGVASHVGFGDDSVSSYAASTTTEDTHDWVDVSSAGSRPIAKQPPLPSFQGTASVARSSATTTSTTTKKNSWAKPDKSKEAKLGPHDESDVWDTYARELGNRRDKTKKPTKKKKQAIEPGDDEDEFD